jgi:hypothetical protein
VKVYDEAEILMITGLGEREAHHERPERVRVTGRDDTRR